MKVTVQGLGALGFLMVIAMVLCTIGISLYGLVLAFKASILIGILALLIEPSPFIIGLVMIFADVNLAQKAADFLNKL